MSEECQLKYLQEPANNICETVKYKILVGEASSSVCPS